MKKNYWKKIVPKFIDYYSLIHILAGILIGLVLTLAYYDYGWINGFRKYIITGVSLLVLWEVFEVCLRYIKKYNNKLYKWLLKFLPGYIFSRESVVNITGDIIIGAAGLVIIYLIF